MKKFFKQFSRTITRWKHSRVIVCINILYFIRYTTLRLPLTKPSDFVIILSYVCNYTFDSRTTTTRRVIWGAARRSSITFMLFFFFVQINQRAICKFARSRRHINYIRKGRARFRAAVTANRVGEYCYRGGGMHAILLISYLASCCGREMLLLANLVLDRPIAIWLRQRLIGRYTYTSGRSKGTTLSYEKSIVQWPALLSIRFSLPYSMCTHCPYTRLRASNLIDTHF